MEFVFVKYSGTGNDFLIFDDRLLQMANLPSTTFQRWCHRKEGVGADGILLLQHGLKADFKMQYFNSDGHEAEMCGNGARCLIHYAHHVLKLHLGNHYTLETKNNCYRGEIFPDDRIDLSMVEIGKINEIDVSCLKSERFKDGGFINTGVPHCVLEVKDLALVDVFIDGRKIRHHPIFPQGANVDFFQVVGKNQLRALVYERGVEDETFSSGTGATATALIAAHLYGWQNLVHVEMKGGNLEVRFDEHLQNVHLCGKVKKICTGTIT